MTGFENIAWSPGPSQRNSPSIWESPELLAFPNISDVQGISPPQAHQSRDGSLGYQYFFSDRNTFERPSGLRRLWQRVKKRLSLPLKVKREGGSYADEVELPRSDLINLAEFFPSETRKSSFAFNKAQGFDMSSMLRSEPMKLCQLILVRDAALQCVGELGKHANVQFNDLNAHKNVFQRHFVTEVRRCEEMERKLRYLEEQVADCIPNIPLKPIDVSHIAIPTANEINTIEARLDDLEKNMASLNHNDAFLRKTLNSLKEYMQVLQRVEQFFEVHMEDEAMNTIEEHGDNDGELFNNKRGAPESPLDVPMSPLLSKDGAEKDNGWFVAGVIPLNKRSSFERVLWRACRRTAFVRISDVIVELEDPLTWEKIEKCVFIIFFKGESLKQIIAKVCDGFNATEYKCLSTSVARQMEMIEYSAQIVDTQVVINSTIELRHQTLLSISEELPKWLKVVHIQKSIYHTLNKCTVDTNGFLAAECWIPEKEIDIVTKSLSKAMKAAGSDVAPILNVVEGQTPPPTYNRTNKFTTVFQSIVDSYGVAAYREVNPAPFTTISFPFLFAVMFGDAAHGLVLVLAAFFFIRYEKTILQKRIRDEIFNTFFGGRYIILLMGLFSMYTGLIYNDAFAKSFTLFESRWKNPYNYSEIESWLKQPSSKEMLVTLDPRMAYNHQEGPYPIGVDPVWNIADNRLSFLNSMKMKASVLIGVAQMTFGILLSLLNHIFFRSNIDIFTNFIPQIIFMSCIFIYLCGQMVVKWLYFSVFPGTVFGLDYPGPYCAPSLLIGLINMFMFKTRPPGFQNINGTDTHPSCYLNQWYPNQSLIEGFLILTALLCVPVMLAGKPIAEYLKHRNANRPKGSNGQLPEETQLVEDGRSTSSEKHDLTDVIVHQAIHTIEFVLGCVSHTASYLRLWALSLAHAQLSEVLWHMVLMAGMTIGEGSWIGAISAYLAFGAFGVLTLCILVTMEGLSAFLHALRLHWVEFQSKFYLGTGSAFRPFSLPESLETAQLLSETEVRGDEAADGVEHKKSTHHIARE